MISMTSAGYATELSVLLRGAQVRACLPLTERNYRW